MTPAAFIHPPKQRIAARFGRTADTYESDACVQMEILARTAEMMAGNIGTGELWCDIGSGAGMLIDLLAPLPKDTQIVCMDIAAQTLRRAVQSRRTKLAASGDIDLPPFKYDIFDGAAAISMLQWVSSPKDALRNIAAMLKPSGKFYFSVFTSGAFEEIAELRERMGLGAAVQMPTVKEFLTMLEDAKFDLSADDMRFFDKTLWFPDAISALSSLSGAGATAAGGKLLNRSELDTLCKDYTLMFSKNGKVPLTYRAVIGRANKKY